MPERIGFVGLGIMGGPMARNLMRAGRELVLHNRTRRKAEELAAEGEAEVADSTAEVARKSGITITMLPGPPEVEEVVAGRGGLLEVLASIAGHVVRSRIARRTYPGSDRFSQW